MTMAQICLKSIIKLKFGDAEFRTVSFCSFFLCNCHTFNLCGTDDAECTPDPVTFFGAIQSFDNLFGCTPKI